MPITALFGGTFNPFHIGHYEILKALNADEEIGKILLLPDKIPPHKSSSNLISDENRIEMCKIAANDFEKVELCLIEFEREGKSYTFDTVCELIKKYPDTKFSFVMGGDMLVYFPNWYKSEELMKMMDFIVFKRLDTDELEFSKSVEAFRKKGMNIKVMEEKIPLVSSTEIRNDFFNSNELLPKKIFEFLKEREEYAR